MCARTCRGYTWNSMNHSHCGHECSKGGMLNTSHLYLYHCCLRVGERTGGSQLGQTPEKEERLGGDLAFPSPHLPPLLGSPFPSPPFPSYCPEPGLPISSLDLGFHQPHCPFSASLQPKEASRTQINPSLSHSCSSTPTPPEGQFKCEVPGLPALLTHPLPCLQGPRV